MQSNHQSHLISSVVGLGSTTILPDEKPVILYTGIINDNPLPGYQVQNYAIPENYSNPYLTKWIKPDDNPILIPTVEDVTEFRDPTTAWMLNGQWEMTIGSVKDMLGISYLYRSPDFITWTLVDHPLHQQDNVGMWECPDFYPVSTTREEGLGTSVIDGDIKHVFKVSLDLTRYDYYTIGKYDTEQDLYIPDEGMIDGWAGLRYDWGNFYASKSFYDPSKTRPLKDPQGQLGLDQSGKQLLLWPVAEIETLRDQNQQLSNVELRQGDRVEVEGITAAQADVDVVFTFPGLDKAEMYDTKWDETFPPEKLARRICQVMGTTVQGGLGPFGLLTLTSQNLEEYTPIFFRVFNTPDTKHKVLMCSDAMPQSLSPYVFVRDTFKRLCGCRFSRQQDFTQKFDHSVEESFAAGGKTIITSRVYPTLALGDNAHLHVFNNGTEIITIESLNAWSMKSPQMN
ncbi:hypothetical protein L1987_04252 [Smallanthus sonchifolius]|uniref:Uncharacterized protein n=1 Tax=Smallanthus sonchifolius TaxID=185202 RepID=A0ACB9KCW0_9ASTR|nr:hypothetical protein L1987_04252 [Smallanthus sonchifolius]